MGGQGFETPPFHLVNSITEQHIGPFTTMIDAMLAKQIGEPGWNTAAVMDDRDFKAHLDRLVARRKAQS